MAYTSSTMEGVLPLIASGKVRDLYDVDPNTLLFVATDRISAYDVIMKNGIPGKGVLLTQMAAFWFRLLSEELPDLSHHFVSLDIPPSIPQNVQSSLRHRSMQVRRLRVLPIEAIVRGYITGSAWSEYRKCGTVNGKIVQAGMEESQKFEKPIYTPSTKAEQGKHDENITTEQAAELVGLKYARRVEELALKLYKVAHGNALERGIIIADTKFEFGVDDKTDEVVLVDEVLTPDSSRFWPKETYQVGKSQASFDKQFLRDWLTSSGLKGKRDVSMPQDVVERTSDKYREAYRILTGQTLDEALKGTGS